MSRLLWICAFLAMLSVTSGAYEWNPVQKKVFMDDCVAACVKNPKVHESRKSGCDAYCGCVMKNGQEQFSAKDFDDMDDDARASRTSEKIKEFQLMFPVCSKRVWTN